MMLTLLRKLDVEMARRLDEQGASSIEYAFLISLIATIIFVAVGALGGNLQSIFSQITELLPDF
jgi:pilus assembly protein Flp/PilA